MTKKFKSILILALVAILVWNYRDKINEFATEMWYRLPFSILKVIILTKKEEK